MPAKPNFAVLGMAKKIKRLEEEQKAEKETTARLTAENARLRHIVEVLERRLNPSSSAD